MKKKIRDPSSLTGEEKCTLVPTLCPQASRSRKETVPGGSTDSQEWILSVALGSGLGAKRTPCQEGVGSFLVLS